MSIHSKRPHHRFAVPLPRVARGRLKEARIKQSLGLVQIFCPVKETNRTHSRGYVEDSRA